VTQTCLTETVVQVGRTHFVTGEYTPEIEAEQWIPFEAVTRV